MSSNHPTRKGKGRSRTGCANCKARHVKCDEARPSCTQCLFSERVCEGYDFSSARLKLKPWSLPKMSSASSNESPKQALELHQASPIQRYYVELFQQRLASKYFSGFNADLWARTMLQASHSEPSILRILVAVSASVDRELVPVSDLFPSSSVLYQDAVTETRRLVSTERPSLQSIVLCGIGLATLGVLRSEYSAALTHLESCIRLTDVNGYMAQSSLGLLDREILQGLLDMDHLASQYLDGRPPLLSIEIAHLRDEDCAATVTRAFRSLEALSRRVLLFTRAKAEKYRSQNLGQVPLEVSAELQNLSADLSSWSNKYSDVLWEASAGLNEEVSFQSKLLLIHHALTVVEASTSLYAEQMTYDTFASEFARIVSLADDVQSSHVFMRGFSADVFGIVKPLYVTALKCRDLELRSRAIKLLGSITPRQEGVWSAVVMDSIARSVVDLEEGCRELDNCGTHIAEHHRVHSVIANIDFEKKTASVYCALRPNGMDGEWESREVRVCWTSHSPG